MRGSAAHKRLGLPMCFEETGYCGARENDNLNIVGLWWLGVRAKPNVPTPTLFLFAAHPTVPCKTGLARRVRRPLP